MANLIDLIHDYAEARHKHGAPEYNATSRAALDAVMAEVHRRTQSQQAPLSADRIRAVQAQHYKRHELADCTYETRLDIEAFARAIERAHGIGAKEPPHAQ